MHAVTHLGEVTGKRSDVVSGNRWTANVTGRLTMTRSCCVWNALRIIELTRYAAGERPPGVALCYACLVIEMGTIALLASLDGAVTAGIDACAIAADLTSAARGAVAQLIMLACARGIASICRAGIAIIGAAGGCGGEVTRIIAAGTAITLFAGIDMTVPAQAACVDIGRASRCGSRAELLRITRCRTWTTSGSRGQKHISRTSCSAITVFGDITGGSGSDGATTQMCNGSYVYIGRTGAIDTITLLRDIT